MTLRRRQRAQSFVIAALAMTSMLGALSMVIDAGVYFVIQRQLQNLADAAALAAVWYSPACDAANMQDAGCQTSGWGAPPPTCTVVGELGPCTISNEWVQANESAVLSLCAGPNLPAGAIEPAVDAHMGTALNVPSLNTWVVTLDCNAPHWFGRVLPGVNLTMDIRASSSTALGWLTDGGQIVGNSPPPPPNAHLVARLII